jgi:hypothetical protein
MNFKFIIYVSQDGRYKYLTQEHGLTNNINEAYGYVSPTIAFIHAKEHKGRVFLKLKKRSVEVFEEDFL